MDITNSDQLEAILIEALGDAIDFVLDKVYETLQEQMAAMGLEDRSGGLYNAWEQNIQMKLGNALVAEFGFAPAELDYFPNPFPDGVHGSDMSGNLGKGNSPNDVRQGFAEIIFEGLAPICPRLGQAGGTHEARDAWTPTLELIDKMLDVWIRLGFAQTGFTVQRSGSGNWTFWGGA